MIFSVIPSKNIYIEFYENFKSDPDTVYKTIFRFLNIDDQHKIINDIVNPSHHIILSFLDKYFSVLADKTTKIRKIVGLRGKYVQPIKNFVFAKRIIEHKAIEKSYDEIIKREFIGTYEYLDSLRKSK